MLEVATRGLFEVFWLLLVSRWVRKVRGRSRALVWAIVVACVFPAMIPLSVAVLLVCGILSIPQETGIGWVVAFGVLSFLGARIVALFTLRLELAQEPICLWSGYWKTILFGCTYVQYRLGKLSGGIAVPPNVVARVESSEVDGGSGTRLVDWR